MSVDTKKVLVGSTSMVKVIDIKRAVSKNKYKKHCSFPCGLSLLVIFWFEFDILHFVASVNIYNQETQINKKK